MKTIAIEISSGIVQKVYKVLNAPTEGVIVIDDDNLGQSSDRIIEALEQLEPYKAVYEVEYKEIHTKLSRYVNSEDLKEKSKVVKKQIYVRLGFSDILLPKKLADNSKDYVTLFDNDNKGVGDTDVYTIGYEFEDGTECDEEGNVL